jgi:hypothetical protein
MELSHADNFASRSAICSRKPAIEGNKRHYLGAIMHKCISNLMVVVHIPYPAGTVPAIRQCHQATN